jgi:hypothetical protein
VASKYPYDYTPIDQLITALRHYSAELGDDPGEPTIDERQGDLTFLFREAQTASLLMTWSSGSVSQWAKARIARHQVGRRLILGIRRCHLCDLLETQHVGTEKKKCLYQATEFEPR